MANQTAIQTLAPETAALVRGIADQFAIEGEYVVGEEVKSGHINSPYRAPYELEDGARRR